MPWLLPLSREPELMDDPAIAEADHLHALSALARINAVSRTAARLAAAVVRLLPDEPGEPTRPPFTVVDVASGGGDVTIGLARRLARAAAGRTSLRVVGVDISPRAVERARMAARKSGADVAFEARDVLAEGLPPCDAAVSSLFLHHFDDDHARRLLESMATAARRGIVVSDLVRSRLGLGLAVVGTTLLSTSRIARVDGPLSVRAARTPAEYRRLFDAAGLQEATIRRVWPERVEIVWRRAVAEVTR
ncbi:MAG: methyltransferase domain-containing protein [Pirellulales bacterium]